MKLNGGRHITGVLRGYDPFMNLVLDETVEDVTATEKHSIGMVVSDESNIEGWNSSSEFTSHLSGL